MTRAVKLSFLITITAMVPIQEDDPAGFSKAMEQAIRDTGLLHQLGDGVDVESVRFTIVEV